MATVIDAFVVSLGLDASQFSAGQKQSVEDLRKLEEAAGAANDGIVKSTQKRSKAEQDADAATKRANKERAEAEKKRQADADAAAKQAEENAKRIADAYSRVKSEILGYIAAAAAATGISKMVSNAAAVDQALANTSTVLGMSATDLEAWENTAKRFGASADGVVSSLHSITDAKAKWANGQAPGQDFQMAASRLGLDVEALLGDKTTALQAERMMIEALHKAAPEQRAALAHQLGLSDSDVILASKSSDEIDSAFSGAKENTSHSESATREVQKINQEWEIFQEKLKRFGDVLITDLGPYFEKVIGWLSQMADWAEKNRGPAEAIVVAFTALTALKFAGLITDLLKIGKLLGGIEKGAAGAGGKLGGLGNAAKFAATVAIADAAVTAADPEDKAGSWMDQFGAASWIDHQASKIGLGRSYEEQAEAALASGYKLTPEQEAALSAKRAREGTGDTGESDDASEQPESAPSSPSPDVAKIRGIRNNNPGNLNFANQEGAVREDGSGRFAKFSSMEEGVSALAKQLQRYASRGIDSVKDIISKYAPAFENNTQAYIQTIAKHMGVKDVDHLDLNDPKVLKGLIRGITDYETKRGAVSDAQIDGGIAMNAQKRGALASMAVVRAASQASKPQRTASAGGDTSIQISNQTIYTQAKDGKEVADTLKKVATGPSATVAQVNTGLS